MKRRLLYFCATLSAAIGLFFLILWPFSYGYYTTFGVDRDQVDGPVSVYYRYYRCRWPGDGSVRVGSGANHYAKGAKKVEPFDLGGRFFKKPRRDPPTSLWNHLGFWWIVFEEDDRFSKEDPSLQKPYQAWVGVPSFLPAMGCFTVTFFCWRKRRGYSERVV